VQNQGCAENFESSDNRGLPRSNTSGRNNCIFRIINELGVSEVHACLRMHF